MSFYLRLVHTELPDDATWKIAIQYVEFKYVLSIQAKSNIILNKFVLHLWQDYGHCTNHFGGRQKNFKNALWYYLTKINCDVLRWCYWV